MAKDPKKKRKLAPVAPPKSPSGNKSGGFGTSFFTGKYGIPGLIKGAYNYMTQNNNQQASSSNQNSNTAPIQLNPNGVSSQPINDGSHPLYRATFGDEPSFITYPNYYGGQSEFLQNILNLANENLPPAPKYKEEPLKYLRQLQSSGLEARDNQATGGLISDLIRNLQNPQNFSQGFEPIQQAANLNFQRNTIPSLAERFTGLGGGNQISGAQNPYTAQAAQDLNTQLAGLQTQYSQNAQGQAYSGLNSLLGNRLGERGQQLNLSELLGRLGIANNADQFSRYSPLLNLAAQPRYGSAFTPGGGGVASSLIQTGGNLLGNYLTGGAYGAAQGINALSGRY